MSWLFTHVFSCMWSTQCCISCVIKGQFVNQLKCWTWLKIPLNPCMQDQDWGERKHLPDWIHSLLYHTCHFSLFPPVQDNLWKNALNSRIDQAAIRAFDMVFIIAQKSYDGYEYYDFFDQVFQKLKGDPFQSNLTSQKEASMTEYKSINVIIENTELFTVMPLFYWRIPGEPVLRLSARRSAAIRDGAEGGRERRQRPSWWRAAAADNEKEKQLSILW